MAWLGWIARERGRGGARGNPRSRPGSSSRVVRLAHAALQRLPEAYTDGAAVEAKQHFTAVCRSLGVVLTPAARGLDHLDAYVLAPLRDAAFLTVLLLDREIDLLERSGVALTDALAQVSVDWEADFGSMLAEYERRQRRPDSLVFTRDNTVSTPGPGQTYALPPHLVVRERAEEAVRRARQRSSGDPFAEREQELRIKRRRDDFGVNGVVLTGGAAAREAIRTAFVTTVVVADAVQYRARRVPGDKVAPVYHETLGRFLAGSARLVCDLDPTNLHR